VNFNHGVALLTAICKDKGIDADYSPCIDDFVSRVSQSDIVGFSCVTDLDYYGCLFYMKLAKDFGKKVLAGGVYARRGGIFDRRVVDLVCRGEAEIITDYLLMGDERVFKEKYYQKSLDGLPLPDLSNVTGYEFQRGLDILKGVKIIPYQTSRGCPYNCSFCETRYQPKGIRIKHTIKDDLLCLHAIYNPDLFYLMDEQPPYHLKEWRDQFSDLYFPFQCYIRADIEPRYLDFLIKHGLRLCAFGIETGSETLRNNGLKKNLTDKQIFQTINILKSNSISYVPFYMDGVPGETKKDKELTEEMIKKIGGFPIIWKYQNLRESIMEV
jgi:radical SAM superfamily enzyme YgiQ (UPF0313 family)